MDVEAYLKRQGWRGSGHSLDDTDRGIKKPLQISKKVDALGVGLQKYGAVSDQWWMRAYDQGLKDLGTGKEGDLEKVRKHGHDRGGLYARFVKGQPIPGTIDEYIAGMQSHGASEKQKKQKTKRKIDSSAEDGISLERRIALMQRTGSSLETMGDQVDVRILVQLYVDEATRRGIIPAKEGSRPKSSRQAPSDADMAKVVQLAGFSSNKQELKRQHMVRALKRAAMQHIESTRPP